MVKSWGSLDMGRAISRTSPRSVMWATRLVPPLGGPAAAVGAGEDGVRSGGVVGQRELFCHLISCQTEEGHAA
jgi:hypothetical protein